MMSSLESIEEIEIKDESIDKQMKSDFFNNDFDLSQINEFINQEINYPTVDSDQNNTNRSKPKPNRSDPNRHNRTYVQILQEMFPQRNSVRYVEEGRFGPAHQPVFRIAVHVNGMVFYGSSRTKQSARHEAAKQAIQGMRSPFVRPDNRRHSSYISDSHRYEPYSHRFERQSLTDYGHGVGYDFAADGRSRFDYDYRYDYRYEPYRDDRSGLYYREVRPPQPQVIYYSSPTRPSFECLDTTQLTESSDNISSVNKSTNDFTTDDYNDESFVEFKEGSDEKSDQNISENLVDEQQECINKFISNNKKERIILKVLSETPINQNPVSVIHELHPDAKWDNIGSENTDGKHSVIFKMRLSLPMANQTFIGSGRTKKLAKSEAASKALLKMYNISFNSQNPDNPQSFVAKSTVHIAQEPMFLKQEIANRIGSAVMLKCNQVWDKLTDLKKWSVLSSIVLTNDCDINFVDVICLTSGSKCVKGDSLSMNGYALNDCHAEVLARRCFLDYLYTQIEKLIENNFQDKPEFILERRSDTFGFKLKKSIKVNLFISTAPCGDSRVFSPKEELESDAHPNRVTRGVLRAKIEGGEGTIPVKRDAILTWDGILQGHQRLQFMSCSDKIAVWNVVGIQGALLSHMLEPIYLESVVLGSLFNYEHLIRALHGRLNLNFDSNSLKSLPEGYHMNRSKVAKSQLKEDITRQLTKAPSYAINWIKSDDKPEVISCENGRTHIETGVSRLSKRSLFSRFCSLLGRRAPTLPTCSLGSSIPVIYREGKTGSLEYQTAKTQCMQTFQEQNLGNWIQVPTEIDLFRL